MIRAEMIDSGAQGPSPGDVCAQLERILASPGFSASSQRRALLRYLVEEALTGQADRLKGFAIAVAVFGRDESFDAQADPLVRVEAMRLRRELDIYYGTAGTRAPVRISIPKGAYVPAFAWRDGYGQTTSAAIAAQAGATSTDPSGAIPRPADPAQERPVSGGPRPREMLMGLALVMVLLAGSAAALMLRQWASPLTPVAVQQAHGVTLMVRHFLPLGGSREDEYLAFGFAQQLTTALMRFSGLSLYSAPPAPSPRGRGAADDSGPKPAERFRFGRLRSPGHDPDQRATYPPRRAACRGPDRPHRVERDL